MEELIVSLMTREITMKSHQEAEDKRKKSITFKTSTIDEDEDEDEDGN